MEFDVTTTKHYNVDCCNDCPFSYCKEDTSCVFDSFDDPNYEYFCTNKDAIEISDAKSRYIGIELSRYGECPIPDWCPFKH